MRGLLRPREAQRGGTWIEQACHALGCRLPTSRFTTREAPHRFLCGTPEEAPADYILISFTRFRGLAPHDQACTWQLQIGFQKLSTGTPMPSRRSLDSSPFDRVTILIWRCYWQVRLSSRSFSADRSHAASCMRSRNAWLKPAISYRQLTNRFDKKMAIRTYIHTAAILPTAHGSVDPTGLCASMGLPRSRPGPHCLSKTGSREAKPGTSVLHTY